MFFFFASVECFCLFVVGEKGLLVGYCLFEGRGGASIQLVKQWQT